MNEPFDIIVIGGGVIGLSAAVAMKQRNYHVAVIDAGPLAVDGQALNERVYAVNQASMSLLESLDVWGSINKLHTSPYTNMYVWDAKTGAHIEFDSRLIAHDRLGTIVNETAIKQALLSKAAELGISLLSNSKVGSVHTAEESAVVDCGKNSWQASLIIIADGASSMTRELLGVGLTAWPYHQQALVATVETEKPHHSTAFQVFNPDGPLAFLPLANLKQSSIVWSTTPARAKNLMAMDDETFNNELTLAFAAKLGQSRVVGRRFHFPLSMRHVQQYKGTRWLIMGDAAHTIHPLAGLGLNLGLADLAAWVDILSTAKHPPYSNRSLASYQRNRKQAVWKIIVLMEGIKALFANPLSSVADLRGFGIRICNHLPLLKRFLIEQASGKNF